MVVPKVLGFLVALAPAVLAAASVEFSMDGPPAAAKVVGDVEFVPGRRGQAAHFTKAAHVRFTPGAALDPKQGTIEMWVKPDWDAADKKRHAFFHTGGGDTHVTIFTTGRGKLLFVYKAESDSWHGTQVSIAHWRPGQWHHVRAAWTSAKDGTISCLLEADG